MATETSLPTLADEVEKNRFLEGFSRAGRARVAQALSYQDFPSGTYLFREGDPPEGVCLVLRGDVEIVKTANGTEKVLGHFSPGHYLGEVAVLDGHGRSTDARARGNVVTALIPGEVLLDVLALEPVSLTIGLFQNVLKNLRRTNELFVQEAVRKEKLSLVGEMASSLMHDLRNPIAAVHMAADLITMNHTDDETVLCCDKIRLQCDRVVAMAAELLEFSRGETKLDLNPTDTVAFIQRFSHLNEDYFRSTGLKFSIQAEPAPIEIDTMRMLRLVQNLVTNAVDALKDQADGQVAIRAEVKEASLRLIVADNGPGIPEAIQATLFEPFVTYGKKNGTGLGMAIARNVVTAHGGTITFVTAPGQGTEFIVELPQKMHIPGTAAELGLDGAASLGN